ncbi:MAG: M20/M25/M40 family metallo-hydrolase [bacterium]
MTVDLAARTRAWALALTARPSVTGTAEEAAFGPWLAEQLVKSDRFGAAEVWTFPVAVGDGRQCVAMLLRAAGSATVLLTGHYDTVTFDDYGPLAPLATLPEALATALRAKLDLSALGPGERLAREDLASGAFLPGRGLLDMKAGLAAGLAVAENFAANPDAIGNLLFLAVPDEEATSAGARAAAAELKTIAARRGVDLVAAINLDAIADTGDGSAGRAIALGTVGKVLPTAFVAGVPTHSGFPYNGLNAAVLLAAICARVEWAAELTDDSAGQPGTPPSLLSMRDGKLGYDVTTPATAFAAWNVLLHRRRPDDILAAFEGLCHAAVQGCLAALKERARQHRLPGGEVLPVVKFYRYEAVLQAARLRGDVDAKLAGLAVTLAASGLSLPEICGRGTALVWLASELPGPAVVLGFGSVPYLATHLSASAEARRLEAVVREVASAAGSVAVTEYFAGISDMSFFGEADETVLHAVAANTPLWGSAIRWPVGGALAQVPTVNIGPWGRDYHTPLERLQLDYGFNVLPGLIRDVVERVLA